MPRPLCCTLRLAQTLVLPRQLVWVCGVLCTGHSDPEFQGQALTVSQILSPVRSYPPDLLYQNALASVVIQAFGEHVSRTSGD